ncbi:triphosphoribosyl-dephospho-CoA synthase [Aequitasia blattaphilus]|uniref:triphosphoribosyl-dephospho-CoA synthase n=1 Tax=Aequitasia blattaphilus TaxID=2949332 RepID=A0ABT1E970_9FIRM|nr:triphosphoribosyl-dephospho-CoA synthase [Aequitasia blattaphilus]MCP1102376.1 triphosphoribosyl-dephospho-CoA synthase [Aequitasia blattaphilus]MCR8615016.1 triphosphoribosyl-dephospho-CoA synthase [Aequitasia blattaphilus]
MKALSSQTIHGACNRVGILAWKSLLEEVYTTLKPGLVDCYSNGAHKDMNVALFELSARVIYPYFSRMTYVGRVMEGSYEEVFKVVREWGVAAERAMFKGTKGVNTHKGLIFSMGIFCAAYGLCRKHHHQINLDNLIQEQTELVRTTLMKEIGDIVKLKRGLGARGEALSGYASLQKLGLPKLQQGIREGRNFNQVKIETLFSLMTQVEDANVLSRTNPETLKEMQEIAIHFIENGGMGQDNAFLKLKRLDSYFIGKNISPGGCADLLALTIFINSLLGDDGHGIQ